jgi:hypothetical protein
MGRDWVDRHLGITEALGRSTGVSEEFLLELHKDAMKQIQGQ